MNNVKPQAGQILELQSLRGIAALTVAIGHALTYYYTTSSYGSMVLNGRGAVVVFFVLSGYVLTHSLRDSRFDKYSVLRFWGQRAFRIYPALWIACTLGTWYLVTLHWRLPLTDAGPLGMFRSDRFNPLYITGSFTGIVAYVLPQLWTIHVEILGSMALPMIAFVALHKPRWAIWVLMIAALLISYLLGNYTIYHSALFLMDFVAGAALAVGALRPLLHNLPAPKKFVAVGLIGLSLTRFLPILDYFSPTAHLIETVLAVVVIGLLVERETPAWIRSAALQFVGKISYSIYLLSFVVMCTLAKGLAVFEFHERIRLNIVVLSALLALLTFVTVIPLAWLSYNYVERLGVSIGKIVLAKGRSGGVPPSRPITGQMHPVTPSSIQLHKTV